MPCLVLINGGPAAGKSTLAWRYAADHPLTVVLDIDLVRSMVGGWKQHPLEAGRLARQLAVAAIPAALHGGHVVVIPQLLGRVDFVEELASTAESVGVPFVEVSLIVSVETALGRYRSRSAASRDNVEVAEPAADPSSVVPAHIAAVERVVAERRRTVRLGGEDGDEPYPHLLAAIEAASKGDDPPAGARTSSHR